MIITKWSEVIKRFSELRQEYPIKFFFHVKPNSPFGDRTAAVVVRRETLLALTEAKTAHIMATTINTAASIAYVRLAQWLLQTTFTLSNLP